MRSLPRSLACMILLAACANGTTIVSIPEENGTIVGRVLVVPGNTPLAGALVTMNPGARSVTTDATGHFTLEDVPLEAEYLVTASKTGFLAQSVQVPVTRQQTFISVELTLLRFGEVAAR